MLIVFFNNRLCCTYTHSAAVVRCAEIKLFHSFIGNGYRTAPHIISAVLRTRKQIHKFCFFKFKTVSVFFTKTYSKVNLISYGLSRRHIYKRNIIFLKSHLYNFIFRRKLCIILTCFIVRFISEPFIIQYGKLTVFPYFGQILRKFFTKLLSFLIFRKYKAVIRRFEISFYQNKLIARTHCGTDDRFIIGNSVNHSRYKCSVSIIPVIEIFYLGIRKSPLNRFVKNIIGNHTYCNTFIIKLFQLFRLFLIFVLTACCNKCTQNKNQYQQACFT